VNVAGVAELLKGVDVRPGLALLLSLFAAQAAVGHDVIHYS
jgi:hypothetical protein